MQKLTLKAKWWPYKANNLTNLRLMQKCWPSNTQKSKFNQNLPLKNRKFDKNGLFKPKKKKKKKKKNMRKYPKKDCVKAGLLVKRPVLFSIWFFRIWFVHFHIYSLKWWCQEEEEEEKEEEEKMVLKLCTLWLPVEPLRALMEYDRKFNSLHSTL